MKKNIHLLLSKNVLNNMECVFNTVAPSQGQFLPQRMFGNVWRHFVVVTTEVGVGRVGYCHLWVGAKDDAKHSQCTGKSSVTMNFPAPNVHSAEAGKCWLNTRYLVFASGLVGLATPGQHSRAGQLLSGCVSLTAQMPPALTVSKSLALWKPQFLHLENGDNTPSPAGHLGPE